jgi:rhodanese-related sulfurtransferase
MTERTVTPGELKELLAQEPPPLLIDVCTPPEFREIHVLGAQNVPLDSLSADALPTTGNGQESGPLYFICRTGKRGREACEKIWKLGLENAATVEGGTNACAAAGLPVHRGRKAVSLERQVRIAAGSMVVVGAALAIAVHPWCAAISGFVGAGLVYAGATDTCGMAAVLGRMRWNRS